MTETSCFPDQNLTAANCLNIHAFPNGVQIGDWRVDTRAGRLSRDGGERAVEPKVMDLLVLLAASPGAVVTREEIFATLWPDTVVGEDTLARVISKLRKALDDDPKAPRYIETISKRGYRLIAEVSAPAPSAASSLAPVTRWRMFAAAGAIVLALGAAFLLWPRESPTAPLLERAEDAYFQYTRADNETAIALYEQALVADPDLPAAQAGLARALVQRVLRWPNPPGGEDFTRTTLGEALETGRLETAQARATLDRALSLVTRAAQTAPNDADVQLALGLTLAARRDFTGAEAAYRRALTLDPNAWGALINLGDLADMRDAPAQALPLYERAFETMQRVYAREPQRIRPWQAEVGVLIAARHGEAGRTAEAERWYRRVLSQSPMHAPSVDGLAALLAARGDATAARTLCTEHAERAGPSPGCEALR